MRNKRTTHTIPRNCLRQRSASSCVIMRYITSSRLIIYVKWDIYNVFSLKCFGKIKKLKFWLSFLPNDVWLRSYLAILHNKANLRDLIAATGLVILLKIRFKSSICSPCNLEIWRMTSKNHRSPLLYYIKHCASFQSYRWIQTWVTVRKCSFWVKICDFLSCVTLKFDGWPWKSIGHHSSILRQALCIIP